MEKKLTKAQIDRFVSDAIWEVDSNRGGEDPHRELKELEAHKEWLSRRQAFLDDSWREGIITDQEWFDLNEKLSNQKIGIAYAVKNLLVHMTKMSRWDIGYATEARNEVKLPKRTEEYIGRSKMITRHSLGLKDGV